MAANPIMTHMMIQANESGNPKISGVADEKTAYPGQMIAKDVIIIVDINIMRERRIEAFLAVA